MTSSVPPYPHGGTGNHGGAMIAIFTCVLSRKPRVGRTYGSVRVCPSARDGNHARVGARLRIARTGTWADDIASQRAIRRGGPHAECDGRSAVRALLSPRR